MGKEAVHYRVGEEAHDEQEDWNSCPSEENVVAVQLVEGWVADHLVDDIFVITWWHGPSSGDKPGHQA